MKMLLVTSKVHGELLVNLDNVTAIIPSFENECNMYFIEKDDAIKIKGSLKDIATKINQLQELEG